MTTQELEFLKTFGPLAVIIVIALKMLQDTIPTKEAIAGLAEAIDRIADAQKQHNETILKMCIEMGKNAKDKSDGW